MSVAAPSRAARTTRAARPARPLADRGAHREPARPLARRALVIAIVLPLWALLSKSFLDRSGTFVGLANYAAYFANPILVDSLFNSVFVALLATAIVIPLAFLYAYALTRTCLPFKGFFYALALLPLFAPSLLSALSLVYIFGNQGFLRWMLFGNTIYGPIGIVIAQVNYVFPHALMILVTALALSDGRLYEVADALGTSKRRIFTTVTLPGARYGLISAAFVTFTLVITDFGIPKVIGGQFNVLATDVYRAVVGQQNFEMGAVVGMILLVPAVAAFAVDKLVNRRQVALLSARAVPYVPQPKAGRDLGFMLYCLAMGLILAVTLGVAVWASFITYWPYNLSFTLNNYQFGRFEPNGWSPYFTSLKMAALGLDHRHGDHLHRRLPDGEDPGPAGGTDARPVPGDAADGGTGAGPRPRLRLLLQRRLEPPERPLCDAGDPGDQHDHALLHGLAHHGDDGLEADRPRVRGGLGFAQGAVLADLPQGDRADLHAGHSRHRGLSLRQCADHRLGRDLPLRCPHQARLDLDRAHGRGGLHRRGGGHGDADRGDRHRREAAAPAARPAGVRAAAGLAAAVGRAATAATT
jgi:ABC-type spermidine/putrescine transport system permease subunit I